MVRGTTADARLGSPIPDQPAAPTSTALSTQAARASGRGRGRPPVLRPARTRAPWPTRTTGSAIGPFGARVDAVKLVPSRVEDHPALEAFLRDHNALRVARGGELLDSSDHPDFLAWSGDQLMGAATYVISGPDCELLTPARQQAVQGNRIRLAVRRARHRSARRLHPPVGGHHQRQRVCVAVLPTPWFPTCAPSPRGRQREPKSPRNPRYQPRAHTASDFERRTRVGDGPVRP